MNEKPRTVHLTDWSHKAEQSRHLLWCVGYRILAKGETKRTAIRAVSETLGISKNTVDNCCKKHIRIEYHDQEDPQ